MSTKISVLLVEDDEDLKHQIEGVLKMNNMEVMTASNGANALDLLRKRPFHVVLTDIKMPVMDGLTFLQEAKLLKIKTHFILFSGNVDKECAIQSLRLGAIDLIEKPFDVKDIIDSIHRAVTQGDVQTRQKLEALNLSYLQIRVLEMLLQGMSNKAIADAINLSEQGVKYHFTRLLEKYKVKNRKDLRAKILEVLNQKTAQ